MLYELVELMVQIGRNSHAVCLLIQHHLFSVHLENKLQW